MKLQVQSIHFDADVSLVNVGASAIISGVMFGHKKGLKIQPQKYAMYAYRLSKKRSASSAAIQPVPAEVIA